MSQICRLLNHDTPRPGEIYQTPITNGMDQVVTVEAAMPGALDFERGFMVQVDFQIWPMFQALDVDHILTCLEVGDPSMWRRPRLISGGVECFWSGGVLLEASGHVEDLCERYQVLRRAAELGRHFVADTSRCVSSVIR
jgi:hypothetical protein